MTNKKQVVKKEKTKKVPHSFVGKYRLPHFRIELPSGGTVVNGPYINGRHQLPVQLHLIIEQQLEDGAWVRRYLTESQQKFLVILRYGVPGSYALPDGWTSSRTKNRYDTGLWQDGGVEEGGAKADLDVIDPAIEIFDFFLMADESAIITPQRLMGRLAIEGNLFYTTASDSSITATPIRPYFLPSSRLVVNVDESAYVGPYFNVTVYYILLPAGLTILETLALDEYISADGEGGKYLLSIFCNQGAFVGEKANKMGVLFGKDNSFEDILISDIWSSQYPAPAHHRVSYGKFNTNLRAIRVTQELFPYTDSGNRGVLSAVDNFGNVIRLRISTQNKGVSYEFTSF
ncbi:MULTISPECIES: hypothetical protein [Pseudomonas]|jgi:hypothetical protein|nr:MULTISPECIES: hypothetical protein [Pseudomonas]NWE00181.1 hypothetical protein [Pseudomonas sp. IPO3749]NWF18759.1 hypothetical protein [Pseudomonas sp. IPO3749]